ncbi:hypothetical protein N7481_006259 [Penicillium waksmanii]|uniref:uncharacterized protein n=1 Tax=Penicillium waksmanii TaxID=69791 RepID=UPI002546E425|nr:uncharacterized protein N7481_006259 [Penicillium waksmanii]KAJ5984160.1 hypothetical protein N7481_006259 [Penicillium waksmanii]
MGDVGRAFRPIAPRTIPPGGGPGDERSPGGGTGIPPEEAKMKRASTACKECQKRRTRCTGMPCTECVTHGRECVTDELSDKRRKASARRTQEELNDTRSILESLLRLIRIGDAASLQSMVQTVRGGADLDEIRNFLDQVLPAQSSTQHNILNPQHPQHGIDPSMMDPNMRDFFGPNSQ